MERWIIEQTEQGGTIRHDSPPFFLARWTIGGDPDALAAIDGPCFTDEGSGGGEDAICIYGFQWNGRPPNQAEFESLMRQAVLKIDDYIFKHL